jgi:SPP1 family predicted phage head-tail adaptor
MQAGKLRTKIKLLTASKKRDSTGEFLAPTVFATCWSDSQPLANKYADTPYHTGTEATSMLEIRYIAGVTSAMTVQIGTQIYNIEAVIDPDDRKIKLNLMVYLRNDGLVS